MVGNEERLWAHRPCAGQFRVIDGEALQPAREHCFENLDLVDLMRQVYCVEARTDGCSATDFDVVLEEQLNQRARDLPRPVAAASRP
jgi:hypothetical protein